MSPLARAGDRSPAVSLSHLPLATRHLLVLRPEACRWPVGDLDHESFAFCGERRAGRSPYCLRHECLAHEGSR